MSSNVLSAMGVVIVVYCSSHNWNTLFLGANAVADVMAERYGATKSDILNTVSRLPTVMEKHGKNLVMESH